MLDILLKLMLFFIGFLILIRGADTFIEYAGKLGRKLGMKPVLIGLSLVSFGTSFPELSIAIFGAVKNSSGIVGGNVIGSNIANIGLFLGFAGFIKNLSIKKNLLTIETPLMLFSMLILYYFMQNDFLISKFEGIILLSIFVIYIIIIFNKGLNNIKDPLITELVQETKSHLGRIKLLLFTILGLTGLLLGSYIIVNSGIGIARILGINEGIIALTAMALGTSIPEITSSIIALKKGEREVAYGGIIGSVIFNTLLIIGVGSLITPLIISPQILHDGLIMIFFGILMLPFAVSKFKLNKWFSSIILLLYTSWIISVFF